MLSLLKTLISFSNLNNINNEEFGKISFLAITKLVIVVESFFKNISSFVFLLNRVIISFLFSEILLDEKVIKIKKYINSNWNIWW